MRARGLFLLFALAALAPGETWAAEDIVSGVSTDLIQIQSDFTGTEIVVFGAVEGAAPGTAPEDHHIVAVLRGPETQVTVRRQARFLGIWVTAEQATFTGMPGYYYLASTRPIEEMAPPNLLRRLALGGTALGTAADVGAERQAELRAAAVRNLAREQLYGEAAGGIEFLSPSLFRARIPVPANVPPGEYHAEVYLFRSGGLVTLQSSPLFVDKTGLERRVYEFAYSASFAYGFVSVLMAIAFGWLGFALLRPR